MNKMRDYRFAAHVLLFDVDEFVLRMIENCAPFVEKIYVAYSKTPWSYNPSAKDSFENPTPKELLLSSNYFDKIEILEGVWDYEQDQRNACLNRAKEDGIDFLIIHDADEFYSFADYQRNLQMIRENPGFDLFVTPWCSFWRNLSYVVESKNGSIVVGYPEFAVNCHSGVSFIQARKVDFSSRLALPGLCCHLSYVRSDEKTWTKINTWAHSHQFDRKSWFQTKWLKWHEGTRFLHPVDPSAWDKVVRFEGELPEVLQDFPEPFHYEYEMSFCDRLQSLFADTRERLRIGRRRIGSFLRKRKKKD